MGWQPIETAPKDGSEILVWDEKDGAFVAFWHKRYGEWLWTTHQLNGDELLTATHWMPLPEPPQ